MLDFLTIPLVAIAAANARYWLSGFAVREWGPSFPYGTLTLNLLGSLVVGFFMIWATERVLIDPRWLLLVVVGFCGAFTTFSSYAFETIAYFDQGQWLLMFSQRFRRRPALSVAGVRGHGSGEGAVKWQALWRSKSRFA